ncbi:MAG: hypothetical protein ABH858_00645, partial [Candidatus Omnitrophota bacterium]
TIFFLLKQPKINTATAVLSRRDTPEVSCRGWKRGRACPEEYSGQAAWRVGYVGNRGLSRFPVFFI